MKALVLAGGFPQIDLIDKLRERGVETLLADYFENPVAKDHADRFFRISTLDTEAIKELAVKERVDFLITVCTDQSLLTVARVSEELGLPCYLSYETARNVTNKVYMKKIMQENGIPTARHIVALDIESVRAAKLQYPVIIKPADCNSSKGVKKVFSDHELEAAFVEASNFSRTNSVIAEEYIDGTELSVDVYIEDGKAVVLDTTYSEKIKDRNKFVIFRSWHSLPLNRAVRNEIQNTVQALADCFGLKNTPMLVQMIASGDKVYVIEFSARTGGGVKHITIEKVCGADMVSAVIDLTLGKKPHIVPEKSEKKYMVDEYIYCYEGIYDRAEGFEELKAEKIISDYYIFRWRGSGFNMINNSGDRIAGYTIEADTLDEMKEKHIKTNSRFRILTAEGEDIARHDLLEPFDISAIYRKG